MKHSRVKPILDVLLDGKEYKPLLGTQSICIKAVFISEQNMGFSANFKFMLINAHVEMNLRRNK